MEACIDRGARIVRVHDVPATRDAVQMMEAVLGMRPRCGGNTTPFRRTTSRFVPRLSLR